MTAGCSDSHTKHTNAKRRQKVEFVFLLNLVVHEDTVKF
jgi:hypothetical protein